VSSVKQTDISKQRMKMSKEREKNTARQRLRNVKIEKNVTQQNLAVLKI